MNFMREVENIGIIPVITIHDEKKAVPLAEALLEGGICLAEITFRTKAAAECIKQITKNIPEMIICAGTILRAEQAAAAIDAGAKFVISPGLNPRVVSYCIEQKIPIIPGVVTPSEIETAMELGLDILKFFPAEQSGGIKYIKTISAPYPEVKFIPTGGITPANIALYSSFEKVIAVGTSYVAEKSLIEAGEFADITSRCKEVLKIIRGTL